MDTRIINLFTDYYDRLTDGRYVEGCMGTSDPQEIMVLNASLASVYTINHLLKEEIKNETV